MMAIMLITRCTLPFPLSSHEPQVQGYKYIKGELVDLHCELLLPVRIQNTQYDDQNE